MDYADILHILSLDPKLKGIRIMKMIIKLCFFVSGFFLLSSLYSCGNNKPEGPADQANFNFPNDEYEAWFGGPEYYSKWSNGPSSDPDYFPIAVWLQSPGNAIKYKNIGINLYIGLWQGPTESQLSELTAAGMNVIAAQNSTALNSQFNRVIKGWSHQDEPDNAQPDGTGGYGPCVSPGEIQSLYYKMKTADSSRPVYLNLGQGVANDEWPGRGSCSGQNDDYPEYIAGADIISFDIYPAVSTRANVSGNLWLVALGVERLRQWADYSKPVWVWLETTHISNPNVRPTPHQIQAEVWMALIHGAMGIGYFAHEFTPSFIEAGLLAYSDITDAVREINKQIQSLAPVLNSQTVINGVSVGSSNSVVPIATMLKRFKNSTYLFTVAMRDATTTGTFTLTNIPETATLEVLGENRQLQITNGVVSDHFKGYDVHLYRIDH
jgi:hypothetical protein